MVRTYKRVKNKARNSWSTENMELATQKVFHSEMSLRGAATHFNIPFSTLKRRVNSLKKSAAAGSEINFSRFVSPGHPTVFSAEDEKDLAERLTSLSRRGFGLTPSQVRSAAFVYAEKNGIPHPWSQETQQAGKDWFSGFMKRNSDLSLRKPEGLSLARAAGMNKKAVQEFYDLLCELCDEMKITDKPEKIFNMDESGFPLNNVPSKIVSQKGIREVVKLTNAERGENVTVVACCSASGIFIPPFVIFKGVRFKDIYKQDLPSGSEVAMTDSGYINEDVFLKWLQHFQAHRPPGKCLLILDGHASHCCLKCLDFCRENEIEMLCLPPHTTHALQPLDRTVFKPVKTFYHQEATHFIHNNPSTSLKKFHFGKLFSAAWKKGATCHSAVKGFECTGIFPFNPSSISDEKFSPSLHFLDTSAPTEIQPTCSKTAENEVAQTCAKSHTTMSKNPTTALSPKNTMSTAPHRPKETRTSPFSEILRTPLKEEAKPKRKNSRKLAARHLTSDGNYMQTKTKRRLEMNPEAETETSSKYPKTARPQKDTSKIHADENIPCGFCGLKYLTEKSARKGDWIKCQKCQVWYHEVCVGAIGKKQFVCGKCM